VITLAAGQAQDRESPPAKDRRSATEPTPPTGGLADSNCQSVPQRNTKSIFLVVA